MVHPPADNISRIKRKNAPTTKISALARSVVVGCILNPPLRFLDYRRLLVGLVVGGKMNHPLSYRLPAYSFSFSGGYTYPLTP